MGVLLLTALLAACGTSSVTDAASAPTSENGQPSEAATVRVGYFPTIAHIAPIYVAEGEGFLAEENVTVEPVEFARANEAIPALITGEIDALLGVSVGGTLYNAAAQDPGSVKLVGGLITVVEEDLIGGYVRRDLYDSGEITEPDDLAGRAVTLPDRGGAPEYALYVALRDAGVSINEVELQTLPGYQEIEQALRSAAIEVGILGEPYATAVREDDVAVPITPYGETIPGAQLTYVAYGSRLLTDEPEVGERLFRAMYRAIDTYEEARLGGENRDEVIEYLHVALPDTEPEVIDGSPWYYLQEGGRIDIESLEDAAQYFASAGFIEDLLPLEDVVDTRFIDAGS